MYTSNGAAGIGVGQGPPGFQAAANGTGQGPPGYQAAANGMGIGIGMLPPQAATNGIGQDTTPALVPGTGPGPSLPVGPDLPHGMRSWRDGVFGRRPSEPYGQSLRPWRDGVFGPALPGGLIGMGQNGNNADVLDLHDAGVIKELKTAMGLMVPQIGAALPASFYDSPVWEPEAAQLTFQVAMMLASAPGATVSSPEAFVGGAGDTMYLNGAGVYALVAAYQASGSFGPGYVSENFPRLEAFTARPNGTVSAPYFTIGEKAEGEETGLLAGMGTYAYWGLGAVALVGLYMVLKK